MRFVNECLLAGQLAARDACLDCRGIAMRAFVDSQQVPAVVNAFGQANDRLAAQVLQWTLVQANQATQPKNQ